jgi:outer membrane murein-binding lipoprotein Lpp
MSSSSGTPLAAALCIAAPLLTGCVTNPEFVQLQSRVSELEGTNRQLHAQVSTLQERAGSAAAQVATLKRQARSAEAQVSALSRKAAAAPAPSLHAEAGGPPADAQAQAFAETSAQVHALAGDVDQLSKDITQYQSEVEGSLLEITRSLERIK